MKVATDLDVRGALTVAGLPIAPGSTILSGTATPTGATGAVGDYYLDTDDQILYGPKSSLALPIGATQNAYTSQTPEGGSGYVNSGFGMDVTCGVAGYITGLRYYRSSPGGSITLKLWDNAGTMLAQVVNPSDTGTGWKEGVLATPISVSAGQKVRVSAHVGATAPAWPYTAGTSSVPGSGNLTVNAHYKDDGGGLNRPVVVDTTYVRFVDISFVLGLSQWPVALKSVPPGGTTSQVLAKTSATDYAANWAAAAAAGSTILSGFAAPGAGTGNTGDYYLDTTAHILYGPKKDVTGGFGYNRYGIVATSVVNYGGTNRLGSRFHFSVAAQIVGARFYRASGSSLTTRTLDIYGPDNSGTLAGTTITTVETAGSSGWVEAMLATPIPVAANTDWFLAYESPGSHAESTVSDVDASKVSWVSGAFGTGGAPGYPGTSGSYQFPIDLIYQIYETVNPWPVALKSPPPGGTTGQVLKKLSGTDYDWGWVT